LPFIAPNDDAHEIARPKQRPWSSVAMLVVAEFITGNSIAATPKNLAQRRTGRTLQNQFINGE
jgi:hypothetical protein